MKNKIKYLDKFIIVNQRKKILDLPKTALAGKKVLILQQRGWGKGIGRFLARKLQNEGCSLAALTYKQTTHEVIEEQLKSGEVNYKMIICHDEIMSRPGDYLSENDKFSLEEICDALGIDSIWPLVATLRNHVRSYKDKYYYSYKQNVSDEEIIKYIKALYKYTKFIFDEFGPELIIAPNYVALSQIMINLYAQRKGATMISVADTKVESHYIFTHNYLHDKGVFLDRVDELNQGRSETKNRNKARQYIREFREQFKFVDEVADDKTKTKKKTLKQILRQEISPYYHCLRWYLDGPTTNYLESIGTTVDYRPPKTRLRDHYAHKMNKKFIDNFNFYPFEKLGKYVYFPLQFQPEETIDATAPYFNNQIETARLVAMSLPSDYTLAVKEHPQMAGFRPKSYIEKIARTVNVKLIDYRIPSEIVLKKSDLIICPNGTTLMEAAFYNKPAIQLGDLGTTLKLPNIFKHMDLTTLATKIKEVLKKDMHTEEYERKLENYVAAAYDVGFNFKYVKAWERGGEDMEALWQIYKKEVERIVKL